MSYLSSGGVFTVQWTNARRYNLTNTNAERFDMQIKLYQTTNVVQVVYGNWSNAVSASNTNVGQVGLRGSVNTDFNTLSVLSTGNWATPTAGANNAVTCYYNQANTAVKPALGQTYTWTPPLPPVAPANNDCANAISVTPNGTTTCTVTATGTSAGATQSLAGCTGTADDDVWYSFVATSASHIVTVTPTTMSDAVFQVFSGGCAGTSLVCRDATTGTLAETATLTGLTIGNTYHVRIYSAGNGTGQGSFALCVATPPAAPANNECVAAIAVSVNSGTTCTNTTSGTTVAATQSTAGCAGTADDDVWYSFVATSTSHTVSVTPGTLADAVFQVFSGGCGGTSLGCVDNNSGSSVETSTFTGLTIGNTYHMRVYSWGSSITAPGTFTVCVSTPLPPFNPCAVIGNIASCGVSTALTIPAGTGGYATVSTSCGFSTPGVETIYTFTAPQTGIYTIAQASSPFFVDYFFKPVSDGCSGTGWTCIDDLSGASTSVGSSFTLTAGVQYYIMLDPESSAGGAVSFTIGCPPLPPANDNCTGAIALVPGVSCVPTTGTTLAATESLPNNCAGDPNDDVWYSFVATGSTHNVTVTSSTSFDAVIEAFTGSCSGLTSLGCVDGGLSGDTEIATLTGLTPGTTYYVRVYHYSLSIPSTPTFTICVSGPPANDLCANAISIACGSTVTGSTTFASTTGETTLPTSCGDVVTVGAPGVWYTVVGNGQTMTATTCNTTTNYDSRLHVFSGTCLAPVCVTNNDDSNCSASSLLSTVTWNSVHGTTYYILVNGYSGDIGDFALTLTCACNTITFASSTISASCPAGTDGTVTVASPAGGGTPYTYSSNGGTSFQASNAFGGLAPGSFPIQVRDVNGCLSDVTNVTLLGVDTEAPTISCNVQGAPNRPGNGNLTGNNLNPEDAELTNDPNVCGAAFTYDNEANDNCGTATVTQTTGLPSGSLFPVGVTTNTFVVSDGNGNTASCSFTVTVTDIENPTITCPATIVVGTTANSCSGVATYSATATDNCPGVTTTYSPASGSTFALGNTNVTATATDASGHTSTCAFVVSVIDNVPPTITCNVQGAPNGPNSNNLNPEDAVLTNDANVCGAAFTYDNEAADNCGNPIVTQTTGLPSGSIFPVGVTTNTFVVSDGNGNTASCSFTVTVTDIQNPTITCPATVTVGTSPSSCTAVASYTANATDNCPGVTTTFSPASGSTFPLGNTTVTATATDAAGLTATCTFTVSVVDNVPPVAVCTNFTATLDSSGAICVLPILIGNANTDNCGVDTAFVSQCDFDCSNVGANTVTVTVVDNAGNSTTCTSIVTIQDLLPPTALCQGVTVEVDANGNVTVAAADIDNFSYDNCDVATTTINNGNFNCSNIGNNTVILTVTDNHGNTSTCSAIVVVQDNIAPTINCNVQGAPNGPNSNNLNPEDAVLTNDPNVCGAAFTYDNEAADNCGNPIVTQTTGLPSGSIFPVGITTNTFVVNDGNGNTASCSFTVTVTDIQNPTITCPATVTVGTSPSSCTAVASYTANATDNCPGVTTTFSPASGSTFPLGNTIVTATATDAAGLTATCTFTVNVVDNVPPVAVCTNFTATLDSSGAICVLPILIGNANTDNCGVDTAFVSQCDFDCSNVGVNTVTVTVVDNAGNSTTCTSIVTIQDLLPPTALCQGVTVEVDANGNVTVAAADIDNFSYDNCDVATTTINNGSFDCSDLGTNTVVLTVTDNHGNTSTCSAIVVVQDNIAPTINCNVQGAPNGPNSNNLNPEDAVLTNDPNVCGAAFTYDNEAADNCGNPIVTQTTGLPSGSIFPVGITTNTFVVNDGNGNTASCSFTVTVTDIQNPTITCPATVTVGTSPSSCTAVASYTANATDNCPGVTTTFSPASGSTFPLGNTTVTATATDAAGNTATCTFTVTVVDNVPPVAVCTDFTVTLDSSGAICVLPDPDRQCQHRQLRRGHGVCEPMRL